MSYNRIADHPLGKAHRLQVIAYPRSREDFLALADLLREARDLALVTSETLGQSRYHLTCRTTEPELIQALVQGIPGITTQVHPSREVS